MQEPELDQRLLVVLHRLLGLLPAVLPGEGPGLPPGAEVHHPVDVGGGDQAAPRGVVQCRGQHPALRLAPPDGQAEHDDERRHHQHEVDANDALGPEERRAVPRGMGGHGQEVAAQRGQHAHGPIPGADRDAHADADERGEQRVGERAEQAAYDEDAGHRPGAARAHPVGAVVGGREVEDVLDEGEADADHPGVDEPVEDPVELGPAPPQQQEQEQTLAELLGHRGDDRQALRLGEADEEPAESLQQQRGAGRDESAPEQAERQQAPRLGLVAVQPQVGAHQRTHRQRGQPGGQHHRLRGAGQGDDHQDRERAEAHQHRHHDGEGDAVAARLEHGGSVAAGGRRPDLAA